MSDAKNTAAADRILYQIIKNLIKDEKYDSVVHIFTSCETAECNLKLFSTIAMDIYQDVCEAHLKQKTYCDNLPLFRCAEELLRVVATHGPPKELLLDLHLLITVGDKENEHVFMAALKALQILILRRGLHSNDLEWSLSVISDRMKYLALPDILTNGYDEKQKCLLEENLQIHNILVHHASVGLFFGPLVTAACDEPLKDIFHPIANTPRNVLCCFLIELLGKPLSLLDLRKEEEKKTNTSSLQCAESLTTAITKCIGDPLYLLSFVEQKARFKSERHDKKGVDESNFRNIFMSEEKLPLHCLAIYYYMVFVNKTAAIPLVYQPLYILESCLYLIHELLQKDEPPPLHEKALTLLHKLLRNLQHHIIPASSLDVQVYSDICHSICNHIFYTSHLHIHQLGMQALRQYIYSFDYEGRCLIVKDLLNTVKHDGLCGYLITFYRDLGVEAFAVNAELPSFYSGENFRYIYLNHICSLPEGVQTDILENSEKIIASLNFVIFFAIRDTENLTGFWNYNNILHEKFLEPLRKALNFSIAHYKAEIHKVETGSEDKLMQQLELLDINDMNDKDNKLDMQLDRKSELPILNQKLCTFELIHIILARTCESLELKSKCIKSKIN